MHSIWSGMLLLGVLVVVHEFGHFAVAKWLGVRVEVFSVGFGPALFSFKRGHTQYRLSVIPLGGYVRMLGELPDRPIEDADRSESFSHKPVWARACIAFAGPLFNFVLPIFLLFFAFWGSQQVPQPVVGTVLPHTAAAKAGIQSGDRFVQVGDKLTQSFADVVRQVQNNPQKPLDVLLQRKAMDGQVQQIRLQVVPDLKQQDHPLHGTQRVGSLGVLQAVAKPQIAVLPNSVAAKAGLQTNDLILKINDLAVSRIDAVLQLLAQHKDKPIHVELKRQVTVDAQQQDAQKKEAALLKLMLPITNKSASGLFVHKAVKRYGVTVVQLQHPEIQQQLAKTESILHKEAGRLRRQRGLTFAGHHIAQVQEKSPGHSLGLRAGDRIVAVSGKATPHPLMVADVLAQQPSGIHVLGIHSGDEAYVAAVRLVTSKPLVQKGSSTQSLSQDNNNKVALGHSYSWDAYENGPMQSQYVGLFAAFEQATVRTGSMMRDTLLGLGLLVTGKVPPSQLAGPISIFSMAGQAAKQGVVYYLFMMALISVNLGLLNLLPIPGLDGGQLLLFGIEAVRGKPLPPRLQLWVTLMGFAFLISIMAMALCNDISRLS
ncbi:MAG: RIP metalloprotease RseP [Myxococcota bacterium]